jgi:hypothetical protein
MKRALILFVLSSILVGLLPAQQPGLAPTFMGFRLGEIRGARHRSLPCKRLPSGVDVCEIPCSDSSAEVCRALNSTNITFLGDTLVSIAHVAERRSTAATTMIWLRVAPWMRRLFGQPDSVRTGDSVSTKGAGEATVHATTAVEATIHSTTAYWTRYERRRWMAYARPQRGGRRHQPALERNSFLSVGRRHRRGAVSVTGTKQLPGYFAPRARAE